MQPRNTPNPPSTDSSVPPEPDRRTGINPELILPLRLFLGGMFLYAGIQKLTATNFFSKDGAGSIGVQLHGYVADGSPLSFLVRHVALPNAVLIGVLVTLAELWIGLSTLTGLLPRVGAAAGAAMNLLFLLTASWSIRPIFLGPDLPYLAAWITLYLTGPGPYRLDELFRRAFPVRASRPGTPAAASASASASAPVLDPDAVPTMTVLSRSKLLRDLWAAAILATASIGIAGFVNRDQVNGNRAGKKNAPSIQASPTLTADQIAPDDLPPAGGTLIANVGKLKTNRAQTYIDPASGDSAVLIHLADNRLVAFDTICTHASCGVEFDPAEELLICPCHGATFDPAAGAAVRFGPAPRPLVALKIKVLRNGDVYATK